MSEGAAQTARFAQKEREKNMAHKVRIFTTGSDAATETAEILSFDNWTEAHDAARAIWTKDGMGSASVSPDYTLFEDLAGYLNALNADAHFLAFSPQDGFWIGELTEDLAYWAQSGITTPLEMAHDLEIECYHNVYKSVYGVRPRRDLSALTPEQINAITHSLAQSEQEMEAS